MATVKRNCCCDICDCRTCPNGVTMPSTFDVLVQGVTVVPCNATLAQGIGNPNGPFTFGCHRVIQNTTQCRWDTRDIPVSAKIYNQPGCSGVAALNYPNSYSNLTAITGSGIGLQIQASTSGFVGDGPFFFNAALFGGTCQALRNGVVLNNQTSSQDVGFGGTATITPHNPMP